MRTDRILATGALYVVVAAVGLGVGGGLRGLSPGETFAALGLLRGGPTQTQPAAPNVRPAPGPPTPKTTQPDELRATAPDTGVLGHPSKSHDPARRLLQDPPEAATPRQRQEPEQRSEPVREAADEPTSTSGGGDPGSADDDRLSRPDDTDQSQQEPSPSPPSADETTPIPPATPPDPPAEDGPSQSPPEGPSESPSEGPSESPSEDQFESPSGGPPDESSDGSSDGSVTPEAGTPGDA